MTQYHAVLLDETGCEFGHTFEASSREEAWDEINDMFPESRCVQLESPEDTKKREDRILGYFDRRGHTFEEGW
jgi:hypothetical protein